MALPAVGDALLLWLQRTGVHSSRRDQVGGLDQQERQLERNRSFSCTSHVPRHVLRHALRTAVKDNQGRREHALPRRHGHDRATCWPDSPRGSLTAPLAAPGARPICKTGTKWTCAEMTYRGQGASGTDHAVRARNAARRPCSLLALLLFCLPSALLRWRRLQRGLPIFVAHAGRRSPSPA